MTETIARITGSGERIAPYEISDEQMAAGSMFGALKAVVTVKATGAIEKFYSIDAGRTAIGTVMLRHWDERTGVTLPHLPGVFNIYPDHQEHVYDLPSGVRVREDVFVLSGIPDGNAADPPAAYYCVALENATTEEQTIATYAAAQLRGDTEHDVCAEYSPEHQAIFAWNAANERFVRVFGCTTQPCSYELTRDAGKISATDFPGKLANALFDCGGDPLGVLHLRHALQPGERASFALVLSFSNDGRTRAHYEQILDRAVVVTPDPDVNRGVLWVKANMLRSELLAPTGWCFVNDPARSNNSVGRDTAWFAFGSDYVTPDFSRESLRWYLEHMQPSGQVTEYYDIRNGKSEDYGLNINDDTPLAILGLWHYCSVSGDRAFLEAMYPRALRAARYILSQRNGQGLVWCSATGTGPAGICGWRNAIENYRLSGAVTEVNSECYAALQTTARMARALGHADEAEEFDRHALDLRDAINAHLLDKKTELYYLNLDLDGTPRSEVTSDLVFPVMFGVADEETAAHITSRLCVPEFWSDAGLRTVPRDAVDYSPRHGFGLLGGVWVAVTFWFAFAAARFNAQFMAHALSASFRHYALDPRGNNTVPGQFSEWLHGETLANQGMMLSPWYPPRYVWAAIEGAAGLDVSGGTPRVNPRPAAEWKWLGVRNVAVRGRALTWFVLRVPEPRLYANADLESSLACEAYDEDVTALSHRSGDAVTAIVLRRTDGYALFAGNTSSRTAVTSLRLERPIAGRYAVRSFNSLREQWHEEGVLDADDLQRGIPLLIEGQGFCLLELRRTLAAPLPSKV